MINWKVRFNLKNKTFLLRVAFALALPILAYFNLKLEDLVSWGVIFDLLGKFFANPYLGCHDHSTLLLAFPPSPDKRRQGNLGNKSTILA